MTVMTYSEWMQARQCAGKPRYGAKREAKRAAATSAATSRTARALWSPYRCHWCRVWHAARVNWRWSW